MAAGGEHVDARHVTDVTSSCSQPSSGWETFLIREKSLKSMNRSTAGDIPTTRSFVSRFPLRGFASVSAGDV